MSDKYLIEVLVCNDPHDLLKTSNTKILCPNEPNVKKITYIGYDLQTNKNDDKLYWSSVNTFEHEVRNSILILNILSIKPKTESEKKL